MLIQRDDRPSSCDHHHEHQQVLPQDSLEHRSEAAVKATEFELFKLPGELVHMILAEFCDQPRLAALVRTCTACHYGLLESLLRNPEFKSMAAVKKFIESYSATSVSMQHGQPRVVPRKLPPILHYVDDEANYAGNVNSNQPNEVQHQRHNDDDNTAMDIDIDTGGEVEVEGVENDAASSTVKTTSLPSRYIMDYVQPFSVDKGHLVRSISFLQVGSRWEPGIGITDSMVCSILRACPRIERLDLELCKIGDETMYQIRDSNLAHTLRHLNVCNTSITDVGALALTGLYHLTRLDLRETEVGDASLAELVMDCGLLEWIDVSHCENISDEGVEFVIGYLMSMTPDERKKKSKLKYLGIKDCDDVTIDLPEELGLETDDEWATDSDSHSDITMGSAWTISDIDTDDDNHDHHIDMDMDHVNRRPLANNRRRNRRNDGDDVDDEFDTESFDSDSDSDDDDLLAARRGMFARAMLNLQRPRSHSRTPAPAGQNPGEDVRVIAQAMSRAAAAAASAATSYHIRQPGATENDLEPAIVLPRRRRYSEIDSDAMSIGSPPTPGVDVLSFTASDSNQSISSSQPDVRNVRARAAEEVVDDGDWSDIAEEDDDWSDVE
ncbi:hypothetical protein GQ42DRAFT_83182 [Ramicandelaber brevisporus]|nr:hypothetical protein GQ42DRAFT_83182 [Ramicandelaber brevisporus]